MKSFIYWIKASRPQTLIASLAPIIPTSMLCLKLDNFKIEIFIITLLAALLIQIMTNFINDLYDYKKGTDRSDRIGPKRMMQQGKITEQKMMKGIIFIFSIALALGFYLVNIGGIPILVIGISSFLFAYLYTATKIAIAYNGLGELFVFLYFGVIASLGTYYLQTSYISKESVLIGIISGALNVTLLIINNIRDFKDDLSSNKNTLVVIFGVLFGKIEFLLMVILAYSSLYYFLNLIGLGHALFLYIPIFSIVIVLIYRIFTDENFIIKAFPFVSLHILSFIILLSLIIIL